MYSKTRFALTRGSGAQDPLGELAVVHRDEAAVPEAEEVLRGVEAERRRHTHSRDLGEPNA